MMILLLLLVFTCSTVSAETAFVHPGLLHNRGDLERMREAVAKNIEPVASGYEKFRAHPQSRAEYSMQGPFEEIGRNPNVHSREFDQDANAAYQNAIMWAITRDARHAAISKRILDGWAATLKRVMGADAMLMGSLGPFKMVNAAEIIRHTLAGWPEESARRFERLCTDVFYPVLKDFTLFANGNWDTAAVKMVLAMGVYTDNRAMFERALGYYVNGVGNGRLTHYIYDNGQCQESGRDQAHTQLGLAHLGDSCEIAWHQGLDLYSYAENRLLAGFEYTAGYNLGSEVFFIPDLDRTGKYRHEAISARGPLRPVFEQIYHHFVNRLGMPAPYTQEAAERLRPEGPAQGADHPGFGTLLFSRPRRDDDWDGKTAAPGGMIATYSAGAVRLRWIKPRNAGTYAVKRATTGKPFATIAGRLTAPEFTDPKVKPGTLYRYVVAAAGAESVRTSICAGLPSPWRSRDIGAVKAAGSTAFDGRSFTLEAAGANIGGFADEFHFASVPSNGEAIVVARFVPQVSSQFSQMGVMIREALTSGSPHAALLIVPSPAGPNHERPHWSVRLQIRSAADTDSTTAGESPALAAPYVAYNRLMAPLWLRLERCGNRITGSTSPDGRTWTRVGETDLAFKKRAFAGAAACSSLEKVTTTVRFDNVSVAPAL